jgi:hypothetical protein
MRICQYCNKELVTKYQLDFCSSSCAARFNNKHKVNKTISSNYELIQSLISNNVPIATIIKQLGIQRCTFRRAFPDYKGKQGDAKQKKLKFKKYSDEIFEMIEKEGCISKDLQLSQHKEKSWFKKYLISKQGDKCCQCGWCGVHPTTGNVMVELDHIDGNPKNNTINNVRLLCPNCHSLTPTFRNVKRKGNLI